MKINLQKSALKIIEFIKIYANNDISSLVGRKMRSKDMYFYAYTHVQSAGSLWEVFRQRSRRKRHHDIKESRNIHANLQHYIISELSVIRPGNVSVLIGSWCRDSHNKGRFPLNPDNERCHFIIPRSTQGMLWTKVHKFDLSLSFHEYFFQ